MAVEVIGVVDGVEPVDTEVIGYWMMCCGKVVEDGGRRC